MRALLVVNPSASSVTRAGLRLVERALQPEVDLEVTATREPGHATEVARAAAHSVEAIIVYGGDGTVNEVVNGLLGDDQSADVPLGLLPGGGTNVLARNLGYPAKLDDAVPYLLGLMTGARLARIGLGRLHADTPTSGICRSFCLGCGLCLDAEMVRRVSSSGLRRRFGDLAFVLAGVQALTRIRSQQLPVLTVHTPEGPPHTAWWASVANADPLTYWGRRPLRVAPQAAYDRGLDVTAGCTKAVVPTLRWLLQALDGAGHVHDSRCLYIPDRTSFTIEATCPVPLQADGEYLGEVNRLQAVSLPSALPVYA